MKSNSLRTLKSQLGVNIVSLMISMVISMIGLAAAFIILSQMLKVEKENTEAVAINAQSQSLKVFSELDLISAGFGLKPGTEEHIITVSYDNNKNIFWRYKDINTGDIHCVGLEDKPKEDENNNYRLLNQLEIEETCNSTMKLNEFTWKIYKEISRVQQDIPFFQSITILDSLCWPFSNDQKKKHFQINIKLQTIQPVTGNLQEENLSICLINIKGGLSE